ncbi:hypothetical protein V5N11_009415 [Cardamine amara subsp. amara]|uniref:Uncharacterized protein n=1 Tax=Cardamine amara subsp. amara TaxID=228776 RepID=A0ABD0ZEJ4_CARAN
MINCLKGSIHVLMSVLLSTSDDDDDDQEEVVDHVDVHEVREEQEDSMVDAKDETLSLKSSLRKDEKREKKKVQWVDMIGKELAEIREFEHSEEDEYDSDRGKTCVCVIL